MSFISRISRAEQNRKIEEREYRHYANFNWHYSCVGTVSFEFAKIKGARIILHVMSPIFRAAKLKGFTVTTKI